MQVIPRKLKQQRELDHLSQYAAISLKSRGRQTEETDCRIRTPFERDVGRILYSVDFRRLRQKTQVFFNPRNDHICTRMEHVLYVNYIASTIGKALNLNTDLIEAIALGHDIGHTPFGHTGEKELQACLEKYNADFSFQHELHSLRVVDVLAQRKPNQNGLNLTFEVRDGIVSHCGEKYNEYELKPNREKTESELIPGAQKHEPPATLEGCVVRMADKIAYIGRDIEDGARAGLMSFDALPIAIKTELGTTNGEIINTLVKDIIDNSYGHDAVIMSQEKGQAMEELLNNNMRHIYRSDRIQRYDFTVRNIVRGLFEIFLEYGVKPKQLAKESEYNMMFRNFKEYLEKHPETKASTIRKVTDYIAGMTDHFAQTCFNQIFQV
ncbi:MAG TPA: HD domain-containing protein [Clostridiaceae bacterium]|mgnify:CR=1 FL=1|nr:HD domain-containing protein [Clostridiaceae bacterium]